MNAVSNNNDNRLDEIYDKMQGNPVTKFDGNSTGNPVATMTQPVKCTLSFVLRHLRMANSDFLILVDKYRHTHKRTGERSCTLGRN